MKIRTQLVLAWLILSVLPLTGIVLYTYDSSRRALEKAYRREASTIARTMDRRLDAIRGELDQRLAEVSALPIESLPRDVTANDQPVVGNILAAMGETAALVDALEFRPTRLPTPIVGVIASAQPGVVAGRATVPRVAPRHARGRSVSPAPRPSPSASAAPADEVEPPERPESPEPADVDDDDDPDIDIDLGEIEMPREAIVIDIPPMPKMPRFSMTTEQREIIRDIARLSSELGRRSAEMPPEEREATKKALTEKERALNASLKATKDAFDKQMQEAHKQLEARQQAIDERNRLRDEERAKRDAERERRDETRGKPRQPQQAVIVKALEPKPPVSIPVATPPQQQTADQVTVKRRKELTDAERERLRVRAKQTTLILGKRFDAAVRKEGEVVGRITARLRPEEVVKRVLGEADAERDEVPFAVDTEGNVYTRNAVERAKLDRMGVTRRIREGKSLHGIDNWIVVLSQRDQSGLRVGVARPVGENLQELRKTAARNFGYGIGMIAFALIGIIPFANHISRDVKLVTDGAERIAQGDLSTKLPVRSKNEFGQLAVAFNRMAAELTEHQEKLVEQERTHREQEIQQRVLALEYERKSIDLEEARRFQLSMLPKEVPRHERYDVAVFTQTATEVGGDYYDFHLSPDGVLSVTIGDATGHGAKAGTMVTVIKTLFSGYAADIPPGQFLGDAAEKIRRMELGRMAMALSLARFDGRSLTVASAGMPPVLLHRAAQNTVEEIAFAATPLGTLGRTYDERQLDVAAGDTILFLTDGFPELANAEGQQLGYPGALNEFARAATAPNADAVIAQLVDAARRWHGDHPPNDDITFVAVRVA